MHHEKVENSQSLRVLTHLKVQGMSYNSHLTRLISAFILLEPCLTLTNKISVQQGLPKNLNFVFVNRGSSTFIGRSARMRKMKLLRLFRFETNLRVFTGAMEPQLSFDNTSVWSRFSWGPLASMQLAVRGLNPSIQYNAISVTVVRNHMFRDKGREASLKHTRPLSTTTIRPLPINFL